MKIAAALAGAFMLSATAGQADSVQAEPAPPEMTCNTWLYEGGNEAECKESVAFWAGKIAAGVAQNLAEGTGFRPYGDANAPAFQQRPATLQSPAGKAYAAAIDSACAEVRALEPANADMAAIVIAADRCLASAHEFAARDGLNAPETGTAGYMLQQIAGKLMSERSAQPAPAGP